ncbi:hypothetical protein ACWCWD_06540 [Streptomyces sp. NPDC001493]
MTGLLILAAALAPSVVFVARQLWVTRGPALPADARPGRRDATWALLEAAYRLPEYREERWRPEADAA